MKFFQIYEEYIEWLAYGTDRPASPQTLESKRYVFRVLMQYIDNIKIRKITIDHVQKIKKHMIDKGNSPSYIEKVLLTLKCFLEYCREVQDLKTMDPRDIIPPKRKKKIPDYYTQEEIYKILSCIDKSEISGLRTAAIILTILSTGLRISEVTSLRKKDIDRSKRRAIIIGKGDKEGVIFFHKWALKSIDVYLKNRTDDCEYLFATQYRVGEYVQVTPDCARNTMQKLSKIVGFPITPHKLRRTAATLFRHNGGDLMDIQKFLRHEKITTTMGYIGIDYQKIQEAHDKYLRYNTQIQKFLTG